MLSLPAPRTRKRPSLTPMIDVVFLLLVFFMLASQFGIDRVLPLGASGGAAEYTGPPRLVSIEAEGIFLNGSLLALEELSAALIPLTKTRADAIILKPGETVPLQALMDAATVLKQAGFSTLLVAE